MATAHATLPSCSPGRSPIHRRRTQAIRYLRVLAGVALWALTAAVPAMAQEHDGHGMDHGAMEPPADARGDIMRDLEMNQEKLASLADALRDHWDWRPAEDVRSVGEVVGHVAAANMMLPMFFGHHAPEAYRGADQAATMQNLQALEGESDPDAAMEVLRHSFTHAAHGIGMTPAERMSEAVTIFGNEMTVGFAMFMTAAHVHEHLGQLIAYARMNGVVPPWSGGE